VSLTHYKTLLENEFLGQWDLGDGAGGFCKTIVTISKVEPYKPPRRQKKKTIVDGREVMVEEKVKRLKVSFAGKRKAWLAGPESQKIIAGLYGPHIEGWIGKPIILWVDTNVVFGRTKTGGLRPMNRAPKAGERMAELSLNEPVDEAAAKRIAAAVEGNETGREPGEEG
jgi:hypothetical protein